MTDAAREGVVTEDEEAWLWRCGCCGERAGNKRENTLRPCHMPSSRHPLCGWIGTTFIQRVQNNDTTPCHLHTILT